MQNLIEWLEQVKKSPISREHSPPKAFFFTDVCNSRLIKSFFDASFPNQLWGEKIPWLKSFLKHIVFFSV